MNRLLSISILTLFALPAFGATSPSTEEEKSRALLDQDARLAQSIRLHLKRSPLSLLVAKLGAEAKVEMKASPEVADEPAILHVTDRPVKEVMHQVASLFNYRWTRIGQPGEYRYELYQDVKSKLEEKAMRQRERLQAVASLQQAIRPRLEMSRHSPELLLRSASQGAQAARQLEQLSEEQQEALKQTPRYAALLKQAAASYRLREMADPGRRVLIRIIPLLSSAHWNSLIEGQTVQFSTRAEPGSTLLPEQFAAALRTAPPTLTPEGISSPVVVVQDGEAERLEEQKQSDHLTRAEEVRVRVQLGFDGEPGSLRATLMVTPMPLMPVGYRGEHHSLPGLVISGEPSMAEKIQSVASNSSSQAAGPKDPLLDTRRKLKLTTLAVNQEEGPGQLGSLNDLLANLAQGYEVNLVADGYWSEPISLSDETAGERSLRELLDELVLPVAAWKKEVEFIQVRRRDWYHARQAEIPDRLLHSWAARLRQTRRITLEDTAALALAFSDRQLARFPLALRGEGIHIEGIFGGESDDDGSQQLEILRAFGSLLPGQRQALLTGGWVAPGAMTPEARTWLQRALQARIGDQGTLSTIGEDGPGALSLTILKASEPGHSTPEGETVQAQFRFQQSGGSSELFTVPLPRVEVNQPK